MRHRFRYLLVYVPVCTKEDEGDVIMEIGEESIESMNVGVHGKGVLYSNANCVPYLFFKDSWREGEGVKMVYSVVCTMDRTKSFVKWGGGIGRGCGCVRAGRMQSSSSRKHQHRRYVLKYVCVYSQLVVCGQ